jgi:hypothetical protein
MNPIQKFINYIYDLVMRKTELEPNSEVKR